MAAPERWYLAADEKHHVIDVEPAGFGRRATWWIEGRAVAERRTSQERFQLAPATDADKSEGVVTLRFGWFGPAQRVTWYPEGDPAVALGIGGTDFEPEPGSRAARRDAWIAGHPRLFTLQRVLAAASAIAVALAAGWLASRLLAAVPWPAWQLPAIPWPDLPDLPLPHIDLPDWSAPAWLRELLDIAKFVAPLAFAFFLARAELRRHRRRGGRRRD